MRKIALGLLLLSTSTFAVHFTQEDIGLWINAHHQSGFYSVMMNDKQEPYLNVENILTAWLGLKATCNVKRQYCQAKMPPDATPISINGKTHLMRYGKKVQYIPRNALTVKQNKLWLNYKAFAKWLPINATWSLQHFYLQFVPTFSLPSDILSAHARQVERQKSQAKEKKQLEKQKAITPKKVISAEARYRFNWQPSLKNIGRFGASTDANVDVGRGTFYVSGNVGYDPSAQVGQSVYWNYTLHRPGRFYQLRFGDTTVNNTLLLPYLNLQNGVGFSRLKPAQGGGGGFNYVGHTMPWTNVDIYRNGTLVSTQVSKADGSYVISSPEALGGDIFTIIMYFKDGEKKEKQLKVADDYGLILKKSNWNTEVYSGQLDDHQWFAHLAYRYGLTDDLSAGIHALMMPDIRNKKSMAAMLDMAWRPKTWLDVLAEAIKDVAGTDYDVIADMSYFKKHTLQLEMKNINPQSPVNLLQNQVNTLLAAALDDSYQHSISLKDIYDIKTWRLSTTLLHDKLENSLSEQAAGQFNDRWSGVFNAGIVHSRSDSISNNQYADAVVDYQLNNEQLLELGHAWFSNSEGESSLTYRYQGYEKHRFNASVGVTVSDKGHIDADGSLSWLFKNHWLISANVSDNSVSGVISYEGIVSKGEQYRTYDDFGTGSVAGVVMAPPIQPGGKPTPIQGAVVRIDNSVATTDKNGYFFVPDIEVNTRVVARIETSSINANLIPRKKAVVMRLRPGTIIQYNPRLVWAGGIDGQVIADKQIEKGTQVVAVHCDNNKVVAHADVEDDGFFVFNRLSVGHYCLQVKDHGRTLTKPTKVAIKPPEDWASGVQLYEHQNQHQMA